MTADLDGTICPLLSTAPAPGHRHHRPTRGTPDHPDGPVRAGSTTKMFPALLLADMVRRGEVRYDDPVDRHLPRGWRQPSPVTLGYLATHTSGLPRVPFGVVLKALPTWFSNPYQRFGQRQFAASLSRVRLRSPPGTRYRYSNIGFGLLGWLLAEAVDHPFDDLLAERVLRTLGLTDTSSAPAPQATGH